MIDCCVLSIFSVLFAFFVGAFNTTFLITSAVAEFSAGITKLFGLIFAVMLSDFPSPQNQ